MRSPKLIGFLTNLLHAFSLRARLPEVFFTLRRALFLPQAYKRRLYGLYWVTGVCWQPPCVLRAAGAASKLPVPFSACVVSLVTDASLSRSCRISWRTPGRCLAYLSVSQYLGEWAMCGYTQETLHVNLWPGTGRFPLRRRWRRRAEQRPCQPAHCSSRPRKATRPQHGLLPGPGFNFSCVFSSRLPVRVDVPVAAFWPPSGGKQVVRFCSVGCSSFLLSLPRAGTAQAVLFLRGTWSRYVYLAGVCRQGCCYDVFSPDCGASLAVPRSVAPLAVLRASLAGPLVFGPCPRGKASPSQDIRTPSAR